jgi:tetratricopeptide (TPR) repeat protein/wyosine [tRNA(Phe)-imidazoG37] synthetase (radical SAM superfamily)
MVETRQRGIQLFAQGHYPEAIGCFEECLRQAETSEVWNDWAAAQFALGRVREASEGLKRALQLDPRNTQAAQNLRLLNVLVASRQKSSGENQQGLTGKKPVVEEFLQDIQAIPAEDPSLHPSVIEAMQRTHLHSGYFVEKCLERLARLPVEALPKVLEALEKRAETDYRLSIVLGRYYMQAEDYETALRHLRSACDDSALDLFAENTLIACSRRQAAKSGTSCEFEGLEAYLAGSFCDVPWRRLEIYEGGNAALCCLGWVPLPVGDPRKQSLDEIWNSDFAVQIRKSILDGSFRFCSKIHCQYIAARSLARRVGATSAAGKLTPPAPYGPSAELNPADFPARVPHRPDTVRLCYDKTCNLACPQCRKDFYVAKPEEQERMDRDYLPFMLQATQDAQTLGLNGSGEAFASKHCRHFLSLLKRAQFPRLKFWFTSNGLLLNEGAFREFDLYGRVQWIQISVDAARPETYRIVRRGGDFQRVLSTLAFLDDLRRAPGESFWFELRFVVSSMNFRDMPEFVTLGRKFHVDIICFNIIRNWGHFPLAEFEKLNIANPSHPEHQEFLRVLEAPELSDPIVDLGSVAPYRRNASEAVKKSLFGLLSTR